MHDISEVLDDDDRCLLVVIAKRVVDQDLCDLVRIEALALAKDGCSLEVIDVCNDSAVCACFLLDSFADIGPYRPGRIRGTCRKEAWCL